MPYNTQEKHKWQTDISHTFNIASHCTIQFVDLVNWFWNRTRELWTTVLNVGSDNSMNIWSCYPDAWI